MSSAPPRREPAVQATNTRRRRVIGTPTQRAVQVKHVLKEDERCMVGAHAGQSERGGDQREEETERKREEIARMCDEMSGTAFDAKTPEVDVDEAAKLFHDGSALFVDVRTDAEMEVSRIPGALRKDEFEERLRTSREAVSEEQEGQGNDKESIGTVIAYCTVGVRSGRYVEAMKKEYPKLCILNLKGSILSWTHAELPLEDSTGNAAKKVHVYGKRWDRF